MKNIPTKTIVTLLYCGVFVASAQTVFIDIGSDTTYRGVTAPSPDTNGNHWNSTAFGFIGNLVDSAGNATTIDWTPDGLGGVDSYNGIAGATSNPLTTGEIAAAQTILDAGSIGVFAVAEAAMDFYVSSNPTTNVGRFQLQQLTAGQAYDLTFYGATRYVGSQTTYSVFDDSAYSNLLGSVTLNHNDGAGNANVDNVAVVAGLIGPSNANNIFYVQWEGVAVSTEGFINAMSITAVPEPSSFALLSGLMALGWIAIRRRHS